MSPAATITVTDGPDTGRAFPLSDELVHIGRGADNQVVLSDGALAEHQASIVRRQGRLAIYSPESGAVQVDGNDIPPERWVWLPRTAMIQLGKQTILRLDSHETPPSGSADSTPTPSPPRPRGSTKNGERTRRRSRNGDHRPQVARFINDRTGEALVKLGDDGQLPALELAELTEERPRERREARKSNPLLLYGVLATSFVMSLLMLVVDPTAPSAADHREHAEARAALHEFYGDAQQSLLPYQTLLRQALVHQSQGDFAGERDAYRQILRMLNSTDIRNPRTSPNGLTGRQTGRGRSSDDELRAALLTLLSE